METNSFTFVTSGKKRDTFKVTSVACFRSFIRLMVYVGTSHDQAQALACTD